MLNTQFSPWPSFTEEEADVVRDVLLSNRVNYWTGNECRKFEEEFASWTDSAYAVALTNGTVALDVAFKALGIGQNFEDEVIVTSRTFLASVSSIVNAGAVPIFADVDIDSQNVTAPSIEAVITKNTRAIVCVHFAGWPCEMDSIMALAEEKGLFVIEDCAQAHGARYKGRPVGSIGHIGTWSFCQDKIMTTAGEGGMVTTSDRDLWSKMWSYKDHGKSWEAVYDREHPPGFRWVHESFGSNWRMTEMQAAIGRLQLKRMDLWHQARSDHAKAILNICNQFPSLFRTPRVPEYIEHAWYKCYLFIRPEGLKQEWSRDRVLNEINCHGVPCYQGSCSEVYLEKAFEEAGLRPKERLPVARLLGETSLMFLIHPTLTKENIEQACLAISVVAQQATA